MNETIAAKILALLDQIDDMLYETGNLNVISEVGQAVGQVRQAVNENK